MLRALHRWGAAPLPSPPGGGRADWGARAPRIGSSCGPWGPWPTVRTWGVGLIPAPLSGAAGGACCAEEEERCPRTQENPATREGNALRSGVLDRGARLQRPARRPPPRARGARASAARYPAWARDSCSRPALSAGLGGLPSASLHQLLSTLSLPSSSPHLCLCWLHPTGPNPGVLARPLRQGLAPRRSEGGLRGKRPMSIKKRVLPGMGGGCGV